jgi:RNA-binding protein
MNLTGKQRLFLRGLAHHRDPIVQIGHRGLTEAVLRQLDGALETHELVKLRLSKECTENREGLGPRIEDATRSTLVQHIGRIWVFFRARKKDPTIVLPK